MSLYYSTGTAKQNTKFLYYSNSSSKLSLKELYYSDGILKNKVFSSKEIYALKKYTSSIPVLQNSADGNAASSTSYYAFFAGGSLNATYYNTVDAYNSQFIKSNAPTLSNPKTNLCSNSFNSYACFWGGVLRSGNTYSFEYYNNNLTKSSAPNLDSTTSNNSGGILSNYLITPFNAKTYSSICNVYNLSFVKSSIAKSSVLYQNCGTIFNSNGGRAYVVITQSNDNLAIISNGLVVTNLSISLDFNPIGSSYLSLKNNLLALSRGKKFVINDSLVVSSQTSSYPIYTNNSSDVSFNNKFGAIFGGFNSNYSALNQSYIFNDEMVYESQEPLTTARASAASTILERCILIGGGGGTSSYLQSVEAYKF